MTPETNAQKYMRGYRQRKKLEIAATQRIHRKKNAKKVAAYQKDYRAKTAVQRSKHHADWTKKNSSYLRDKWLRDEYGITSLEYEAILKVQHGVCGICKQPPPIGKNLAVDHCHKTNLIRGLLCHLCNSFLGMAHDDNLRLIAALEYLGYKI